MAQLGQLVVSFAANTARFERDIGRAAKLAEKRAKAMQAGFAKASKAIAGLAGAGALAAGGLLKLTQNVAANADSIAKAAKAAGIGGEALQELRFAAEQSGVQARQLDEGMRRLTRRIGLAADGGGPAVKMFEKLGINVRDAGGNVKDTQAVFDESVVKIGGLKTAAEQAAAASALFGDDAGPKLALLLAKGEAGVNSLRESIRRDGGIITNEALEKAEELNDKFGRMETILSAKLNQAILDNSAGMEAMVDSLGELLPHLISMVTATAELLGTLTSMEKIWRLINKEFGTTPIAQLKEKIADTNVELLEMQELLDNGFKRFWSGLNERQIQDKINGLKTRLEKLNEQLEATKKLSENPNIRNVGDVAGSATPPVEGLVKSMTDLTEIMVTANKKADDVTGWLTEIEVTAPKAAKAVEKTGKAIEVSFDNALPSAEDIAKPWEEGAEKIRSIMNELANEIGGSFGRAFNDVSAAFANPNAASITQAVISVADAIGDLFGGNKPPRVEIVNTLNQAPGGINANSPFTDQHGNPIRIAAQRVHDVDRADAQALVNGIAAFDNLIFPLLNDMQRAGVGQALVPGGNSETRQRFLNGDISLDEMLLSRFDQILSGVGGRTEGLVRATGFGTADSGLAALAAATGIENILASFATFKDDVLGGPQSLEEAMSMQGDAVRNLAMDYNGSLESLQALQGGLQTFQQAAAQVLLQIQATRQAVSQGIGATIDQLRLSQQTSPQGRFNFLTGRFDSLAAGLGSQGTSAGVLDTVNQLRALVPQILAEADASGLTGAARTRFIDEQISTLQDVETLAQERLDAIERDKLSEIEAIGSAVGDRLDTVADKEEKTANKNAATAKTMEGAAVTIARTFAGGLQVAFDSPQPLPNPTG